MLRLTCRPGRAMMLSAHIQSGSAVTPPVHPGGLGLAQHARARPRRPYTLDDVKMDVYDFCGREVRCAVSRFPGNEHVYDWLRQPPTRRTWPASACGWTAP